VSGLLYTRRGGLVTPQCQPFPCALHGQQGPQPPLSPVCIRLAPIHARHHTPSVGVRVFIEYVCVRKTMCKSGGHSAAHAGADADGCAPPGAGVPDRAPRGVCCDGRCWWSPRREGWLGGAGSCSRRINTKGCCPMCVCEVVAQVRRCAASYCPVCMTQWGGG
jgi:hypothetical protein